MGQDVRCPACRASFFAGGSGEAVDCPSCGHRVADPAAAAVAAAAGAAAPAPPPPIPDLVRTCPSCGVRYPGSKLRCPGCGAGYAVASAAKAAEKEDSGLPLERQADRKGVLGGAVLLGLAAAWLLVSRAAGRMSVFHPALLALAGIVVIVRNLRRGNYAGENPREPRRRRGHRR